MLWPLGAMIKGHQDMTNNEQKEQPTKHTVPLISQIDPKLDLVITGGKYLQTKITKAPPRTIGAHKRQGRGQYHQHIQRKMTQAHIKIIVRTAGALRQQPNNADHP